MAREGRDARVRRKRASASPQRAAIFFELVAMCLKLAAGFLDLFKLLSRHATSCSNSDHVSRIPPSVYIRLVLAAVFSPPYVLMSVF